MGSMLGETKRQSSSIRFKVRPAERGVVVVIYQERYIAQPQRLRSSGQRHQDDGHEHGEHDKQLVPPEQHELF